jgi:hypothetical protein
MAGIKSTKPMIYDARSSDSGMIQIDIQGWTYEPNDARYSVRTIDYVVTEEITTFLIPGSTSLTYSYPMKTSISDKSVIYTKEKMDEIYTNFGNPIGLTDSFSGQLDYFIMQGLLASVQEDPIYRDAETGMVSLPEDWVLTIVGSTYSIP